MNGLGGRVTAISNWTPAAILANLFASRAVEGGVIALAPRSDPRVVACCAAHPKLGLLLSRFTHAFQVHLDPVVLIVRDDSLPKLAHVEPLASFRDLVALCVIPYCRSLATVYSNPHRISFANSFSFYPWMLDRSNDHLVRARRFLRCRPAGAVRHPRAEARWPCSIPRRGERRLRRPAEDQRCGDGSELLNNGEATTPNGDFRPFRRFGAESAAPPAKGDSRDPRILALRSSLALTNRERKFVGNEWLPGMDSNHDSRLQRPLSYH